jgi:polar amino acid transport system substrate-binding protein
MALTRPLHRLACAAAVAAGISVLAACSSGSSTSGASAQSSAPAAAGSGSASAAGGATLRASVFNNFPPDAYTSNGKLVGWVPDMLTALEKESGLNFQIDQVNQFNGLIPGLQSGRYDMSPSLFYITAQRLQVVDLVTVSQVGTSFGSAKGGAAAVSTATGICGQKIATLSGSVFPTQITELNKGCTAAGKPGATVQVFPDDSSAVLSVTDHRNDLYAGTTDQVAYLQQQGQLTLQPFVYDKQLEAIAFPKGSKYETQIQTAINNLIKSGQYGQVLSKWDLGSMAITQSVINPTAS